jgi:hypothetical protein
VKQEKFMKVGNVAPEAAFAGLFWSNFSAILASGRCRFFTGVQRLNPR